MELTRRDILRYGAVTGASLMLPRFAKRHSEHRVAGQGLAEPWAIQTYEEGVEGASILKGKSLLVVTGKPVYSAADAAHGTMGWLSPAPAGGRLVYFSPNAAASSGSVYLVPRTLPPNATVSVVSFLTNRDAITPSAMVRMTADGRVDIANSAGARQGLSVPVWLAQQRVRIDWCATWVTGRLTLTVWVYVGNDAEAWRPGASIQATFASTCPDFVALSQEGCKASVGFDTLRQFDRAVMPNPYAPLIGVTAQHTYDDFVSGDPVLAGQDGIVGVSGHPRYAVAPVALHGALGVALPPSGGGLLVYDNPYPPAHTGSLYVKVATRGSASSPIVAFQNGPTLLAALRISTEGKLSICDASGRMLDESTYRAKINRWARIDWQHVWDGTTLAVDVKYFPTDPESTDNCTDVTGAIETSATPDTIAIGSTVASWKIHLDTFRTYGDVATWPEPFLPHTRSRPRGRATWAGDATQTTVEVAAYNNAATSVGLLVSTNPELDGAELQAPVPPNPEGWNRWTLSGLNPSTRYYHQLTDTADGGELTRIGVVSSFTTLRPVAVECTIKLAIGSCAQSNPTDMSAFIDMAEWSPDRSVHLGDFGYPNNLTRDVATHMRNWALNATDNGIQKLLAIGCMDYVISDHDDNGSGNSNLPTFNDPVTMASIDAWQQVVPARMEDDQVPPHGRWRSDVEGNVRFVKLDTRSIDKSDTRSTPTDPRSPDSTMLGATQLMWLKRQIDEAAAAHQLIILYSDVAWNGVSPGPPIPVSFSDKWPSYIYERDLISDYAAAAGVHLFIIFGDSHGLQQDDGEHEKNGFASICCGPLDQDLHMHYQDAYQVNYPEGILDDEGPYRHAQQYQRVTISQEPGSGTITVTAEARDCSPVVEGTPLTVATLTKVYTP